MNGSSTAQEAALEPPIRVWRPLARRSDEAALIRQARRGSADAVEVIAYDESDDVASRIDYRA